jgi:hypothetical protein
MSLRTDEGFRVAETCLGTGTIIKDLIMSHFFARSNSRIVGSILTQSTEINLCLFCVCVR